MERRLGSWRYVQTMRSALRFRFSSSYLYAQTVRVTFVCFQFHKGPGSKVLAPPYFREIDCENVLIFIEGWGGSR